MASNAVLQDQRRYAPASVARAQLAIDRALKSRPRIATESEEVGEVIDSGLRSGVRINFVADRRNQFPESIVSFIDELKRMEGLEENWDSYGGLPLNDDAVLPAVQLAIEGLNRCQEPTIVLRPNGGIGLRWRNGQRELEVDIDPDGRCTAFYEDAAGEQEVDKPTEVSQMYPLVHRVCRVA